MKPTAPHYTEYDRNAFEEIERWKAPEQGRIGKAWAIVNRPIDAAGDFLMNVKGVGPALQTVVKGLTDVCNDVAQWSVRPEAIFAEFRNDGHRDVHAYADIARLDLERVDQVVGRLAAKYKLMAGGEGGVSGATGAVGLAVDIPALILINLRAIAEYSAYYGIDPMRQSERVYALKVLAAASLGASSSKSLALAQLTRISKDVAKGRTWKELEQHTFVKLIQKLAKELGIRLTKAKLAQVVPVVGAAVGFGFNYHFTSKVCDAAYHLYRERFLAQKYRPPAAADARVRPPEGKGQQHPPHHDVIDVEAAAAKAACG